MTSLAENKKAYFDYEILEKFEAGLVLTGQETKSAQTGGISIKNAYVTFHNSEAFLINANISKYKFSGPLLDYSPTRSRKLLLKRNEIKRLRSRIEEKYCKRNQKSSKG